MPLLLIGGHRARRNAFSQGFETEGMIALKTIMPKGPLSPGRREEWDGLNTVSTGHTCSQHAWLLRKGRAKMEQCSCKNLAETNEEIYFYNKIIILYY